MYRLRIYSIGKTKEPWLKEAIKEYFKRLQNIVAIEFVWAKSDEQLIALASKESFLICLDAQGKLMDSHQFSTFLIKQFENAGSRLAMVIGGAEGLPEPLKAQFPLISLSPMTFTHQIVRLILIEQIYRAFEIAKGSSYHK